MKIVESGARRDLGDPAAAIRTLEGRELRSRSRAAGSPRLRYAYAEALLADGQADAARSGSSAPPASTPTATPTPLSGWQRWTQTARPDGPAAGGYGAAAVHRSASGS